MTEDEREALRRRLYRPGATGPDVDAYTAMRTAEVPVDAAAPAASRRSRRPVLLAAGGAAVVTLAIGVAVLHQPATPEPVRPSVAAVVDRQRAALVAETTEAARDGFVRALRSGGSAGIVPWLERSASILRGPLGRATGYSTVESAGSGTQTLRLPPQDAAVGGHVTVLVVAERTAGLRWQLLRDAAASDDRSLTTIAGDLDYGTIAFRPGRAPTRLVVTAPDGVRWGAAWVVSD